MLVDEHLEVRDSEQIRGSRTQAAITAWVKTGDHPTLNQSLYLASISQFLDKERYLPEQSIEPLLQRGSGWASPDLRAI